MAARICGGKGELSNRELIEWQRETGRRVSEALETALAAGRAGDGAACAEAARGAAVIFLRRYMEVVGEAVEGGSVGELVEAAARYDAHFARVREEGELLDRVASGSCEAILEAMKEIRLLAGACAGRALGFSNRAAEVDERLDKFVLHSTTEERARSIFECGALYSFKRCVAKGLLTGPALGVEELLDPRRCTEFVSFGIAEHRYYAGEKVANSQRKGWIDEELTEDYQPSVRLFFRREELEALPGYEDDGVHELMVRDEVSLELL
ncbi:MAG: hypothetical protein JSV79_11505, partial [Armatimonadota bacterium]